MSDDHAFLWFTLGSGLLMAAIAGGIIVWGMVF